MGDSIRLSTYKMYTVGWIVALHKELTAARVMLDDEHEQPEDFEQNERDSNAYTWGRIGDHNTVIASLGGGSYGKVSAATTATYMATSFPHLRFGLLVGVGAGIPRLEKGIDIRLGDIVVSLPKDGHPGVVQYDLRKERGDGRFKPVGSLDRPPSILLKGLDKLISERRSGKSEKPEGSEKSEDPKKSKKSKMPEILAKVIELYPKLAESDGKDPPFTYQGEQNDRLFESTTAHVDVPGGEKCTPSLPPNQVSRTISQSIYYVFHLTLTTPLALIWLLLTFPWRVTAVNINPPLPEGTRHWEIDQTQECCHCDPDKEIKRKKRDSNDPEVHYGNIASGDLLVKDGVLRDQMSQHSDIDFLCYEMEAAGLMNNFPCLVVRGICDYADSHKNDRWQNYAALVAAAYAKELLGILDARNVERAQRMERVMAEVSKCLPIIESTANYTKQKVQEVAAKQLDDEIVSWLAAPDPWGEYKEAMEQHHAGTNKWFLQGEAYQHWKTAPASSLWLHGLPGCGKTVLSSAIIKDLDGLKTPTEQLVFFYFTFADAKKRSLDGLVRSLIDQLFTQSDLANQHLKSVFKSNYSQGSKRPTTQSLCRVFSDLTKVCGGIWVVLDALDECDLRNTLGNEGLLMWLRYILTNNYPNLHVIVTSRWETKIGMVLNECIPACNQICLHSDLVDEDIQSLVDTTIGAWVGLKRWRKHEEVQNEIRTHLVENSHGMYESSSDLYFLFLITDLLHRFRWVSCQLYALGDIAAYGDYASLKHALYSLPKTLDETYARILREVPDILLERVKRVLQFLVFSNVPLHVEEALEIPQVFPEARRSKRMISRQPTSNEFMGFRNERSKWRVSTEPAADGFMGCCSNLIKVARQYDNALGTTVDVLQLSHFTVKEYLLSRRSREQTLCDFEDELAKASMAEVCLAYLMELEHNQYMSEVLSLYPLALRAANSWVNYAVRARNYIDDGRPLKHLIKEFLRDKDCQKTYYKLVNDFDHWEGDRGFKMNPYSSSLHDLVAERFAMRPMIHRHTGSMLYHFAYCGLLYAVKEMLRMGFDANVQGGHFGNPLQAAAYQGYKDIIKELLKRGADINGQGGYYGNALQAAVCQGHNDIVERLLEQGADVNAEGGYFGNALAAAIGNSFGKTTKLLLDHNANINNGRDHLLMAISKGSINRIKAFLRTTATVSQEAFNTACKRGDIGIMRLLIEHIASTDVAAYYSNALPAACEGGHYNMVRELLRCNADIEAKDEESRNGLHHAVCNGYVQVVELLLKKYADANIDFDPQGTMLCNILLDSRDAKDKETITRAVELLLDHGLDPNKGPDHLLPAVDIAIWAGCWEVADLLVDRGAKKTESYENKDDLRQAEKLTARRLNALSIPRLPREAI